MFWSKSAYTAGQQRSDLKLRPNEGLSCRLSSLFGEGSNLFPQIQGSRQIFTTPSEASELYFSNDTIKAQKCEYSASQLLSGPCERGSGAHFVSIKRPHSDLCVYSQLLPKDHGGKDTCKELDYAVKAGSRRRIWRIQAMWRSDFSRFNTPPSYKQGQFTCVTLGGHWPFKHMFHFHLFAISRLAVSILQTLYRNCLQITSVTLKLMRRIYEKYHLAENIFFGSSC